MLVFFFCLFVSRCIMLLVFLHDAFAASVREGIALCTACCQSINDCHVIEEHTLSHCIRLLLLASDSKPLRLKQKKGTN